LTPLIAAIGGKPDFSTLSFTVNHSVFRYGDFINAVLSFLIVAAVIYFFVVAPFARLMERFHPKRADAPQKDCPFCLSSIPAGASRCPFCTSELAESEHAAIPQV
jgi:large conductance mechanosensitive channel